MPRIILVNKVWMAKQQDIKCQKEVNSSDTGVQMFISRWKLQNRAQS